MSLEQKPKEIPHYWRLAKCHKFQVNYIIFLLINYWINLCSNCFYIFGVHSDYLVIFTLIIFRENKKFIFSITWLNFFFYYWYYRYLRHITSHKYTEMCSCRTTIDLCLTNTGIIVNWFHTILNRNGEEKVCVFALLSSIFLTKREILFWSGIREN